jgi:hypothetical protein
MGVFTVYCVCCGGPSMDLSDWVESRAEEEEEGFNFGAVGLEWLGKCVAVTPVGVFEGTCDDYGRMETEFGTVCVCKGNWEEKNVPATFHADEGFDAEVPGVLLHDFCFSEFLAPLSVAPRKLFRALGRLFVDDWHQQLEGVEYDPRVLDNQGQDYELKTGEGPLVSDPKPLGRVTHVHADRPARIVGALSVIPPEIVFHKILSFLSAGELARFGETCRSAHRMARHEGAWTRLFPICHRSGDTLLFFSCVIARDSYARIEKTARTLVSQLAQLSPRPEPALVEGEWEKWKVPQLKQALRDRGLPVSGTKAVLVSRLREAESDPKKKKII